MGIVGSRPQIERGPTDLDEPSFDTFAQAFEIDRATAEADTLFSDVQERPYRYVPFKGRRKVLKYDRKDRDLLEGEN